jgi:hypothetical protein
MALSASAPTLQTCVELRASLLLDLSRDQKMRDEREQKRDDTEPGIQSCRDQQFSETEQPDKAFSREGLAPVGP